MAEAMTHYQEAIRLKPDYADAHLNLGNALYQLGNLDGAAIHYERPLALAPGSADAHNNVGVVYRKLGRLNEALAHLEQALRLKPDMADAHYNLGLVFSDQGFPEKAEACFQRALARQPNSAEFCNDLGNAGQGPGKSEQATASYQRALQIQPDHVSALNNLAVALQDQARIEEAEAYLHRALHVQPSQVVAHSNLLRCLSYNPRASTKVLFEEHLRWARQHAEPLAVAREPHGNNPAPDRHLRIGYVSPDLREHPVARLVEPLLAAHNHECFEIFCYATGHSADVVTRRLQSLADQWRSLAGLSDDQAAELIRRDAIDILVDLAGHTAGNRILVFARKPAPVQVAHFGYASSTGLSAMDYRFTDAHADPPGMTEALHTEQLIRLPDVAWCYGLTSGPSVNSLPALATGRITFSSFNYLAKINAEVIALWSRIMTALPQSRLLLLSDGTSPGTDRLLAVFEKQGVGSTRVTYLPRKPRANTWNCTTRWIWVSIPSPTTAG